MKQNIFPICIYWWQTQSIEKIVGKKKKRWTFSPFGPGGVRGWTLTHYASSIRCNMDEWHVVDSWHDSPVSLDTKSTPSIPEAIWEQLFKKIEHITKPDPYPGN